MKYKGIIFDLDGVICQTDQYHYQAWKTLADEMGIYFDENINNRLRGVSRMESLEIIVESYEGIISDTEKAMMAEKKNQLYRELLKTMSVKDLSSEVRETLDKLREKGIRLAIGSSSKNAMFILDQIGLKDYFDAISDGNNITKSKPDPEVFLKASAFIYLAPEECLVVEDAVAGVEAARNGGFDSAGIGEASQYNCTTYPLKAFNELLNIV